jgi:hypothetical protein
MKCYCRKAAMIVLLFALMLLVSGLSLAAEGPVTLDEQAAMEERGIEANRTAAIYGRNAVPTEITLLDSLPSRDVLLIPNTTSDYVGIYDPYDGTFLGIFVSGTEYFFTTVNATQGPDGNIYVSDQIQDAVHMFDRQGNYLGDYANSSDGLDNIRGIEFRDDGHLFICTYAQGILEFSAPHTQVGVFIPTNQSQWDIKFLDDGTALVSSSGTNNVIHYNADGSPGSTLYYTRFPEQINPDIADFTSYLNTSMTADSVRDFNTDGSINEVTILDGSRGVFRLGNGNLLITNSTGVYEVEPGTNHIIETENTDGNYFIELCTYTPQGNDPAEIDLSETAFVDTVEQGSSVNESLIIRNLGDMTLYYGIHTDSAWITVTSDTGAVPGSQSDTVTVTFSAASLAPGTYMADLAVVSNDSDEATIIIPVTLEVTEASGNCEYITGDANGNGTFNGLDVTYSVAYFKGGPPPPYECDCPPHGTWFVAGDVNGSCSFNGLDVTYMVAYFKGGPLPHPCPDCPPARIGILNHPSIERPLPQSMETPK